MAKFKITPTTTVTELKEQFRNEVGCVLRVYQGRSEASDGATLVSLGAKEGELECRTSRTVGKFEEAFQNELNLKVKVYTKDNWVKVLEGITLETAGQLPNGMTKAKMEEHLSYKRDEEETAEVVNEGALPETEGNDNSDLKEALTFLESVMYASLDLMDLLKKAIPQDIIIYSINPDYEGQYVVDPVDVHGPYGTIQGTQFMHDGYELLCIQTIERDDDTGECFLENGKYGIPINAENYKAIYSILQSYNCKMFGTVDEVETINFRIADGYDG